MARFKAKKDTQAMVKPPAVLSPEVLAVGTVFTLAEEGDTSLKLAATLIKYRSIKESIKDTEEEIKQAELEEWAVKQSLDSLNRIRAWHEEELKKYEAEIVRLLKEMDENGK